MNGSRSDTPRAGERSSLDALNRTIEGLEARIEGLIGQSGGAGRDRNSDRAGMRASDPLTEIMDRQRTLAQPRERLAQALDRRAPDEQRDRPSARIPLVEQNAGRAAGPSLDDIAHSLRNLRSELKSDISHTISGDLASLRSEIARMADRPAQTVDTSFLKGEVDRLGRMMTDMARDFRPADLEPLRVEFDELRAMMARKPNNDGLARLESRWDGLEARLAETSPNGMQEEIVALAWRLDDMKNSLGALDASPAIRKLEDKLIALAGAVENLGRARNDDTKVLNQFQALDERLDEISRAIAASQRNASQPDISALARLEDRISEMASQFAGLAHSSQTQANHGDVLVDRIAQLGNRIEDLANQKAAEQLEARIAELTQIIDRHQGQTAGTDYTHHFADLSRKIETLDQSDATADVIDRLERLAIRLEEIEAAPVASSNVSHDNSAFHRLETRLSDIAARLDDTIAAPLHDTGSLKGLEQQISNLSALLNEPRGAVSQPASSGVESRMAAIEDYIASNDEYILEAARHAAEAVVEAYARQGTAGTGIGSGEIAALSGLAEDLRALEDFSRSSDERNWRTFEALHETLIQISDRLNTLDDHVVQPQTVTAAQAKVQTQAEAQAAAQALMTERRMAERRAAEAPAVLTRPVAEMPKAAQPVFEDVSEMRDGAMNRMDQRSATVPVFEDALGSESETPTYPDLVDLVEDAGEQPMTAERHTNTQEPPPSKSLIVNLGRKIMSARNKSPKTKDARKVIDPTPALDSTDIMPEDASSTLLEPGNGAPDVKSILAKVRAGKAAASADPKNDKSDIIAAARRAAEAAAIEMGMGQKGAGKPGGKMSPADSAAAPKSGQSLVSKLGENRRPILLAAGAVLLVVMSYPLVSTLIKNRGADDQQAMTIEAPAETQKADIAPAPAPAKVEAKMSADPVAAKQPAPADDGDQVTAPAEVPLYAPATPDAKVTNTTSKDKAAANQPAASDIMLSPGATTDANANLVPADTMAAKQDTTSFNAADDALASKDSAKDAVAIKIPADIKVAALADAAKSGDPLALFEIGARYTDGIGVKTDLKEAAKWYQLASDKGFAPAQYRLANFFEKGSGLDRDIPKAVELYKAAAAQGNASAMHNLAVLLSSGTDGNPDFNGAAKWFESAANLGVTDSQYNLAILYARGNGVTKDFVATYKWFAIAANAGDKDAAQKRDEVASILTPQELIKAKADADLWKAQPLDPAANSVVVPDAWVGKPDTTASIDVKKAIRNIQAILNNNGFDAGKPDGAMGARTVSAIKAFQKSAGLEPTGKIDDVLVRKLLEKNKKG